MCVVHVLYALKIENIYVYRMGLCRLGSLSTYYYLCILILYYVATEYGGTHLVQKFFLTPDTE